MSRPSHRLFASFHQVLQYHVSFFCQNFVVTAQFASQVPKHLSFFIAYFLSYQKFSCVFSISNFHTILYIYIINHLVSFLQCQYNNSLLISIAPIMLKQIHRYIKFSGKAHPQLNQTHLNSFFVTRPFFQCRELLSKGTKKGFRQTAWYGLFTRNPLIQAFSVLLLFLS